MSPHQVAKPETPAKGVSIPLMTRAINALVSFISIFAHLGWLVLVLVILASVIMRYVLGNSLVWLEELQWHIYGAGLMLGLSYALVHDEHVRVDVVAAMWSARTRAMVEIAAMVLLVIPFAALLGYYSLNFVEFSMRTNEISGSPGGLTHRWIIKAFMPFSLFLLALAAFARAWREFVFLLNSRS